MRPLHSSWVGRCARSWEPIPIPEEAGGASLAFFVCSSILPCHGQPGAKPGRLIPTPRTFRFFPLHLFMGRCILAPTASSKERFTPLKSVADHPMAGGNVVKRKSAFILVPLIGYAGLWTLGSVMFLFYFHIFHVSMNLGYTTMIRRIPALLDILTTPLCSFASFFLTSKALLNPSRLPLNAVFRIGITSLFVTVGLDVLITVVIQRINILVYPINLMYVFAWAVALPSVVFGGNHQTSGKGKGLS